MEYLQYPYDATKPMPNPIAVYLNVLTLLGKVHNPNMNAEIVQVPIMNDGILIEFYVYYLLAIV